MAQEVGDVAFYRFSVLKISNYSKDSMTIEKRCGTDKIFPSSYCHRRCARCTRQRVIVKIYDGKTSHPFKPSKGSSHPQNFLPCKAAPATLEERRDETDADDGFKKASTYQLSAAHSTCSLGEQRITALCRLLLLTCRNSSLMFPILKIKEFMTFF